MLRTKYLHPPNPTLPNAPVVLPTLSALVFPHSKPIKKGFLFSKAHRTQKNLFFIRLLPTLKKQEPKPNPQPLPKLCYIISHYESSPKGFASPCTISLLCKIAPLHRSHPLPTLLPTHYESFIICKFFVQKTSQNYVYFVKTCSLKSLLVFYHKNFKKQYDD